MKKKYNNLFEFFDYYSEGGDLSSDEIKIILKAHESNKHRSFNFAGNQPTDIIHSNEKLILIYGNDFFGYYHILNRHFGTSMKPYINNDNNKYNKNPSIFPDDFIPIDILWYALDIFKEGNKVRSNENSDIYEGTVSLNNNNFELRLVTSKDTGIIVSLYPLTFNGKKVKNNVLKNIYRGKSVVSLNCFTMEKVVNTKMFDIKEKKTFNIELVYNSLYELKNACVIIGEKRFDVKISKKNIDKIKFKDLALEITHRGFQKLSKIENDAIAVYNSLI